MLTAYSIFFFLVKDCAIKPVETACFANISHHSLFYEYLSVKSKVATFVYPSFTKSGRKNAEKVELVFLRAKLNVLID